LLASRDIVLRHRRDHRGRQMGARILVNLRRGGVHRWLAKKTISRGPRTLALPAAHTHDVYTNFCGGGGRQKAAAIILEPGD
jgi:hypothetical protein